MKRVLFVDDDPYVLEGLQNLLRRHRRKWEMTFVLGSMVALELLQTQNFDVIVADIQMPEMDGIALLTQLQRDYPRIVRIVLSGHVELQASLRALPVAHQFLTKPCDPVELENVVERAFAVHALVEDPKIQQIVGGIRQLPALPRIYNRLMRILADERTQAKEVALLIGQDMAICAKILQIVNSAFFRLARRITSVEEAVRYLGFTMVRNLALTTEVFRVESHSFSNASFDALQQHALQVAVLARHIVTDPRRSDDAFTAGMLHDIGQLVLAMRMPEQWQRAKTLSCIYQRPLWEVEQELIGVSHASAGAYLLGLWGLPYPIIEAVAYHHQPRAMPPFELDVLAAVHVANALAHEVTPPIDGALVEPVDRHYLSTLRVLTRLDDWRAVARMRADNFSQEPQNL